MSLSEKEVLEKALSSLDGVNIDIYTHYHSGAKERYDFTAIGKMMVVKRMLAEMLSKDLNDYLMPGESEATDDEEMKDLFRFYNPMKNDNLEKKDKLFLLNTVLPMLDKLGGINDSDDACLRCAKRMIAEVAGYEFLNHYRLMREEDVKPLYYKNYEIFKKDVNQSKPTGV